MAHPHKGSQIEADSEADAKSANLLAEDDDHNFTNETTLEKNEIKPNAQHDSETLVQLQVPEYPA
jgi:hypothetical protein